MLNGSQYGILEGIKKKRKMKLATRLVMLSSVDITVASAISQGKSKKFCRGAINLMWYTTTGIKKKVWNDGFFESPELNAYCCTHIVELKMHILVTKRALEMMPIGYLPLNLIARYDRTNLIFLKREM